MKLALAGVLGALALQLSAAHAASRPAAAGKNLRSQTTPVRATADLGFFLVNYYVGGTCTAPNLIKADALHTETCVPYGDKYLMVTCDEEGAHSAYYSDDACTIVVENSEDTWNEFAIGECSHNESYSIQPQCVSELPVAFQQLSSLSGYLDDESCSDDTHAISTQYFVTDKCFEVTGDVSRQNYCSDDGMAIYSYGASGCTTDGTLQTFRSSGCNAPAQSLPADKPDIDLIIASANVILTCNSTGGLPDDDDATGPTYFSRYYYVGDNCEADNLYSVDVVLLNKCVETATAGQYVKVTCEGDVVNSAFYSDDACTTVVAGSESTWSEAPMKTCTNHGSASIQPRCESGIDKEIWWLSHAEGYMGDETCADEDNLLIEQFFVMNKCISDGTKSQQQFCDDKQAVFYYYEGDNCDPTKELTFAPYPIDQCTDPDVTDMTTADLAQLPKASYRTMNCNSTEGIPDDDDVVPLYFTRYLYAGATCEEDKFMSAEVLMTGKCIRHDEESYMLLECDETGAHSALYSDALCTEKIAGSEDTWTNAPLDECTADPSSDGAYSVFPTCTTALKPGVEYLSNVAAYYDDEECSDLTQLVSKQYFVTDQCFQTGPSSSRAMYCDERGVLFQSYQSPDCADDTDVSPSFYDLEACHAPSAEMPEDKATIALMSSSSNRQFACNSTGGLPDEPYYFTRYLYVGDNCDDNNFISAEVLMTDKCLEYGDQFMMLRCDETGAHSAVYSDKFCTTKVEGSDDTWANAPMNTCSTKDGYSVYPTCEEKVKPEVAELSYVGAFLDDDSCSDKQQMISKQYFVTDQCFKTGDKASRAMYCDDRGVVFYSYDTPDCRKDTQNSVSFYTMGECYEPDNEFPEDKAPVSLLSPNSYRTMFCESTGGMPDDDETADAKYFTKYLYAGDNCDSKQLVSAEAITLNQCMESNEDDKYIMVSCDGGIVRTVLYEDEDCTKFVSGSTSYWDNAPMGQCTAKEGYSVFPVCEEKVSKTARKLPHVERYLDEDSCDDEDQLLQQQYFVTDKCLVINNNSSRQQTCNENGLILRFYEGTSCSPDKVSSVMFYKRDTCYAPDESSSIPDDTTDLNLLVEATYRLVDCSGEKDDEDDDDVDGFGGLTVGGLVGVIVGSAVVLAFGVGLFFHLNKKPSEGMESLLDNEH